MHKVYIIQSQKNRRYYIGMTLDLVERIRQHNSGATKSTRSGRPCVLVYFEDNFSKKEAWLRERQIKSYKGGNAFKKLVSGEFA